MSQHTHDKMTKSPDDSHSTAMSSDHPLYIYIFYYHSKTFEGIRSSFDCEHFFTQRSLIVDTAIAADRLDSTCANRISQRKKKTI